MTMPWTGIPWCITSIHIEPLSKTDVQELLPQIDALIATCNRIQAKCKEALKCQN